MNLLTDQDVYAKTVLFLRELGHEVTTAAELGLSTAAESKLLETAHSAGRLFVTRDRDFGGLVFRKGLAAGVLYLRVQPVNLEAVHAELQRVLGLYNQAELTEVFVVVEPGRHRVRRLNPNQNES
jgi:predicted nuclease of predicted toxin-antitoxin system